MFTKCLILVFIILIKNVIGDCTTPQKITAQGSASAITTPPSKLVVMLPKSLEESLSSLVTVEDGTTDEWKVDASITMDPKLEKLAAKFTYDAATTTLTATVDFESVIGSGAISINNQNFAYTATSAVAIASLCQINSRAAIVATTLAAMGIEYANAQTATPTACTPGGSINILKPIGWYAKIVNVNVANGPLSFEVHLSVAPTKKPTKPTEAPTNNPTTNPTNKPTNSPTIKPSFAPTENPTLKPTSSPTKNPTLKPTSDPTKNPTPPTKNPTLNPTASPTIPFKGFINEFAVAGVPRFFEIALHKNVNPANAYFTIYVYGEVVPGEYVESGSGSDPNSPFFGETWPQSLSTWTAGTTYCNGNIKLYSKTFLGTVVSDSIFAVVVDGNTEQFLRFGPNSGTLTAVGGTCNGATTQGNGVAMASTTATTSVSLINKAGDNDGGSRPGDFDWTVSAVTRTLGLNNTGQVFYCPPWTLN